MDIFEALATCVRSQDEAEGRVYGFLYGRITDTNDPQSLGRVKARIGAQESGESSDWLLPLWPGSIEAIPKSGEPVLVGFVDGDPHKGFYAWYPTKATQGRATDFMVLGTTFIGMYNDLVVKLNNLISAYNTLQNDVKAVFTKINGGIAISEGSAVDPAFLATLTSSQDGDVAKSAKAADGSTPSPLDDHKIVLSGFCKVR